MVELTEMQVCLWCREPVAADALFCPFCLEPLSERPEPAPAPPTGDTATGSTHPVVLSLPNHVTVALEEGVRIELGRETGRPDIDDALQPYLDVSRHHAVVELADGVVVVTAIPGTNGTTVEHSKFSGTLPVLEGQRIRLGDHCWLQVRRA